MTLTAVYSATKIPFPAGMSYLTDEEEVLCHLHAERRVQHMVKVKVRAFPPLEHEICDECETPIKSN